MSSEFNTEQRESDKYQSCSSHATYVMLSVENLRRHQIQEEKLDKIERIFYTFCETEEFLNVSHQTLYELMKQGLPSHRVGRNRVFLIKDLIRYIEKH